MPIPSLPAPVERKLDLLFQGLRFSPALGAAGRHAFPNFYPYRFAADEDDPTGQGSAVIPYLMALADGTLLRVRGERGSPWWIDGDRAVGYRLRRDGGALQGEPVSFDPLPAWLSATTSDGFPMAQAGVSLHGDMAVVNVAPGCEYFTAGKGSGDVLRCGFCAYGAPDARSAALGQEDGVPGLPARTYARLRETLSAALAEGRIRHIYLVGGCMTDWTLEAERYLELAAEVQAVNRNRVPVTCGSGALPADKLRELHASGLVDAVCFNLEVWGEELFSRICPGKQRFVGYANWLASLDAAVGLWGPGRVYSAMVAGIELLPRYGLSAREATDLALEGAEELCALGVLPVYSLYFGSGAPGEEQSADALRTYFRELSLGYGEIRRRRGLHLWDGFMCHRCAYMQVECDLDRLADTASPAKETR